MTKRGDRSALARYIDYLAGPDTSHAAIAARINEKNPGARVAGPLVGRWRSQQLDVSPGNLAALARAYDRSPLEAFVAAGLLDFEDAAPGLDAKSRVVLDIVWGGVEIVLDEKLMGAEPESDVVKSLPTMADRRREAREYPQPAKRAARKSAAKKKLEDE